MAPSEYSKQFSDFVETIGKYFQFIVGAMLLTFVGCAILFIHQQHWHSDSILLTILFMFPLLQLMVAYKAKEESICLRGFYTFFLCCIFR